MCVIWKKEHEKVESIFEELQERELSTSVCTDLIKREKSLKVDVKELTAIHDIQKIIDFLPTMRMRHESIEAAQEILDIVRSVIIYIRKVFL